MARMDQSSAHTSSHVLPRRVALQRTNAAGPILRQRTSGCVSTTTAQSRVVSSPSATERSPGARYILLEQAKSICLVYLRRNRISGSDLSVLSNGHSFDSLTHRIRTRQYNVSDNLPRNSQATLSFLITPNLRSSKRFETYCILGRSVANENKPESSRNSTACASKKVVIDVVKELQASPLHPGLLGGVLSFSFNVLMYDRPLHLT